MSEAKITNEQRFGVSAQPAETCPTINKAIATVCDLMDTIRRRERADEAELRQMLDSVEWGLAELVGFRSNGLLEDLRKSNTAIRDWGQEWKSLALDHAPEPETVRA
jgi:hypothetical protein